jgi:tetratricopeptide (TPR) repeat protein
LEHTRSLAGLADDPDHSRNPWFYVIQIGSTESRLAIRFADWNHAIEHPMQFGVSDDRLNLWARAYREGLVAYARGMKAADAGNATEAQTNSNALDASLWRLSQEKIEGDRDRAARDEVQKILGTASVELRGDLASIKGDFSLAQKLLEQAEEEDVDLGYSEPPLYARPPLELLGAACIRAGKFDEARAAYQKALAKRPKSGFALYGIALAWDKQGNRLQATKAYRDFLEAWSHADLELPYVVAAKTYLAHDTGQSSTQIPQ